MWSKTTLIFRVIGVLVFTSVVQAQDNRGTAGVDYPNYFTIPETTFKCSEQKYNPGFYADLETKCQAFHFCYQDRQESFLCPTGTIFNQAVLTCDVWYKSNCSLAPMFYSVNAGPVMERAGKNLPMLLRLRNRSQNKPSLQTSTTSVLDKVSSLYGTDDKAAEQSLDNDASSESNSVTDDKSTDSSKDFGNRNSEQMGSNGIESEKDPEETYESELSKENTEIETDEEMDANLVYDPVTDGYYRNYNQYEAEWQESEPESDEFNDFYDYKNRANEYGSEENSESELNDYVNDDESYEDSDLTVVEDSEYPDFTRRSFQVGQSSQRVRRKPMYVVLDDEQGSESETQEMSEKSNGSESSDTLAESETREGKEMNLTSVETSSPEPFPRPTRIPPHLLELSTETPMTSEEFGSAIFTELVEPHLPDNYGLASTYPQSANQDTSTQSEGTGGEVFDSQSDDETIYIENDIEPESYEPYVSQYEDVVVVPDSGEEAYEESYSESPDQAEADSSDTDDTFVLIPDEYDNVVESDSNEDMAMSNYPEENVYRTQMYADGSPSAGYGNYEDSYRYSSSMDYPENYEHTLTPAGAPLFDGVVPQKWPGELDQGVNVYPEMGTGMYQDMTNDLRDSYQNSYEFQDHLSVNYASSNFDRENAYAYTEQYPYEKELGVTDSPLELPVTEADLDNFSPEDLNEVAESEQELIEAPEPDQPEDVYYVFDFDEEQSSEGNDTKEEKDIFEESSPEGTEHEQDHEYKQLNISNNTSISTSTVALDTDSEKVESKIVDGWSPDSFTIIRDEEPKTGDGWSPDTLAITRDEEPKTDNDWSPDSLTITRDEEPKTTNGWSPDSLTITRDEEPKTSNGWSDSLSITRDEEPKMGNGWSDSLTITRDEEPNTGNGWSSDSLTITRNEEPKINDWAPDSLKVTKDEQPETDAGWSSSSFSTVKDEQIKSPDVKSHSLDTKTMNTFSTASLEQDNQQRPPSYESLSSVKTPYSSNMGSFDFSTDSRFLNNMGYSESMDFGPYGFGPNMGQQFSMMESAQQGKTGNGYLQRMGLTEQPKLSPLSAIQEKMRSMKQGKFGAFKKYMSSNRR